MADSYFWGTFTEMNQPGSFSTQDIMARKVKIIAMGMLINRNIIASYEMEHDGTS